MKLSDLPNPFIIADVGSNWKRHSSDERNLSVALRHIDDAAKCGVSAVKFQLFTHQELYGFEGPSPYALPPEWLPHLAAQCALNNVEFMCSAFSPEGVGKVDSFVNIHKVASCEMKHLGILEAITATGKPVLISTGAAHANEIREVFKHISGTDYRFLECVASYPADPKDYGVYPGYGLSDHTEGSMLALLYASQGCEIFEKHFDSLKGLSGIETPDTKVSTTTQEFKDYCDALRLAAQILIPRPKHARESENDIVVRHRRRLKVIKPMKAGDTLILEENFGPYRSLTTDTRAAGPEFVDEFHGRKVKRDMQIAEGLWFDDLE